jgi:hypothetical protein
MPYPYNIAKNKPILCQFFIFNNIGQRIGVGAKARTTAAYFLCRNCTYMMQLQLRAQRLSFALYIYIEKYKNFI